MKKRFFKKALASSVCAAALGVGGVGSAHADSLLAPLVMSDAFGSGFITVLSLKVRGTGQADHQWRRFGANASHLTDLHYTWLRKSNNLAGMFNLNSACVHENNNGTISPWDMVFQAVNPAFDFVAGIEAPVPPDLGNTVHGHPTTPFYGMAVIDDVANLDSSYTTATSTGRPFTIGEGDMSGFAYVMHLPTGIMFDYKLLNNHRSMASGDFAAGFTSKRSVDLSWNPLNRDTTVWLGVATGTGMTAGNNWGGTITLSQNTLAGQTSPASPVAPVHATGVYDNNERVISGDTNTAITCMGFFTRNNFLNSTQLTNTVDGGWTRKSIAGSNGASGGLIYKAEAKALFGNTVASFQSETSGHLRAANNGTHPNRPN